jgi:hypothetical protein
MFQAFTDGTVTCISKRAKSKEYVCLIDQSLRYSYHCGTQSDNYPTDVVWRHMNGHLFGWFKIFWGARNATKYVEGRHNLLVGKTLRRNIRKFYNNYELFFHIVWSVLYGEATKGTRPNNMATARNRTICNSLRLLQCLILHLNKTFTKSRGLLCCIVQAMVLFVNLSSYVKKIEKGCLLE